MSRLGDFLKTIRGDLSLLDVERGCGIPRFTVSRYESGENIPSEGKLKTLAEFYEIPYADIRQRFYEDLYYSSPEEKVALIACVLENTPEKELLDYLKRRAEKDSL